METMDAVQIAGGVHRVVSISFVIIAIWLGFRSVRGIIKALPYAQLDKVLAYSFIIGLYLQLLLGLLLFTNLSIFGYSVQKAPSSVVEVSDRFWSIEHIVLMLFALFISNLGLIFASKTTLAADKHRKILVYYSASLVLIALSLASIYWK